MTEVPDRLSATLPLQDYVRVARQPGAIAITSYKPILDRVPSTPSMRRPVDAKAHFHLLLSVNQFLFSQAASVAILPSALFGERYSLGARWGSRFSRCCYLISVLSSHLFGGSRAPGLSRSHLDSAVELSCSDRNSLGHCTHCFLAIAQWFVYLSAHPQPM